jgi:hypothetical protein
MSYISYIEARQFLDTRYRRFVIRDQSQYKSK